MKAQNFNRVTNYFKIGMLIVAMGFVVRCSNKDEDEPKISSPLVGVWEYSEEYNEQYFVRYTYTFTFTSDGQMSEIRRNEYEGIYNDTSYIAMEIRGTYSMLTPNSFNGRTTYHSAYEDPYDNIHTNNPGGIVHFEIAKDDISDYLIIGDYDEDNKLRKVK